MTGILKRHTLTVVAITVSLAAIAAQAPATPDSLLVAAKRAAGQEYAGTFLRICVAPDNAAGGRGAGRGGSPPGAGTVPDRATWYAQPYKVFDNLYFVGTRIHSAWALTTSQGIVIIDTLFDYAIEPEIVEGLTKLKLNPRDIKYVLISHAHGDHDQGAALLQSRYGARWSWARRTGPRRCNAPHGSRRGAKARHLIGSDGTTVTLR
jgi:metallo-beta-lactamase class B